MKETSPRARVWAVALSVAAAILHFWAMRQHANDDWWLPALFMAAGGMQAMWALLGSSRPSPSLYRAGILLNGSIMTAWLFSRTVGLPLGLEGREPIGVIDGLATTYEALIVALLIALLGRRTSWTTGRPAAFGSGILLGGSLLTLSLLFISHGGPHHTGLDHHAAGAQFAAAAHPHLIHVLLPGLATASFMAWLLFHLRRHGRPRFSWALHTTSWDQRGTGSARSYAIIHTESSGR